MKSILLSSLFLIASAAAGYAEFDEKLSRGPMIAMAAAAYSNNPQKCIDNVMPGGKVTDLAPSLGSQVREQILGNAADMCCVYRYNQVTKQVKVDCDTFHDGCFAFVVVDDRNKAIGVSYRGSESTEQIIAEVVESLFGSQEIFPTGDKVAQYFNDALNKLFDGGILQALKDARAAHPDYECWVAGHSLGAALASMTGAYLSGKGICSPDKIKQYTFGEPRVGDKTWANSHDKLVPTAFRVIHRQDIIAHIPPEFMGYQHHEAEVYYNNSMSIGSPYKICIAQESQKCSEGDVDLSMDDHDEYYGHEMDDWGIGGCI